MTGHLVMSYHPLDSRLRLMLGLIDGLLRLGFSGRTTWIWPLGLISVRSDGEPFICGYSWRLFSEKRQCWMVYSDLLQYQHQEAYFSIRVLKIQFCTTQFIIFSEVLIEDSNRRLDINSFVLSFFGFMVEAIVEVDESSARVWPFGTSC